MFNCNHVPFKLTSWE